MQHAREWLAGETCRRTLTYFTDNYGKDRAGHTARGHARAVVRLRRQPRRLRVHVHAGQPPVAQEHGRQRRRRRPRRGRRRRRPESQLPRQLGSGRRGLVARSDVRDLPRPVGGVRSPRPRRCCACGDLVDFEFQKNDHTAASLLLYPQGWQQYTPAADDPIFTALAGDDHDPAITGFDPDLGAELYITNGDTLDTAYNREGILAYTPEGIRPKDTTVSGFEYEDSEGAIEAEFKRHRDFSLDLAESADKPDEPDSHLGNTVAGLLRRRVRRVLRRPADGAGAGQAVARRRRAAATASTAAPRRRSPRRSGATASATTRRRASTTTGCAARSPARARATASRSGSPRRRAPSARRRSRTRRRDETTNRVLVLAAEDYTGPTPAQDPSGPKYADEYLAAVHGQRPRRRPLRRRRAADAARRTRSACSRTTTR